MKRFLKDNLPSFYVKSRYRNGAFAYEERGIFHDISLETSDFLDGEDKLVYLMQVYIRDQFKQLPKGDDVYLHVCEVSLLNSDIVLLERWDQINHWEFDDIVGMKKALDENVLPWLQWFTEPNRLIDYLTSLESLGQNSDSADDIKKYGTVLSDKLFLTPPRTRKYFNGAIATLYIQLGNKKAALEHLKKHREFVFNDHVSAKVQSFNDAFDLNISLIDEGIKELEKDEA